MLCINKGFKLSCAYAYAGARGTQLPDGLVTGGRRLASQCCLAELKLAEAYRWYRRPHTDTQRPSSICLIHGSVKLIHTEAERISEPAETRTHSHPHSVNSASLNHIMLGCSGIRLD